MNIYNHFCNQEAHVSPLLSHRLTGAYTYAHNFTVSLSAMFSTPKVQSIISTLLADPTIYTLNVKSLGKTLQPHQYFHHLFYLSIPTNLFTITVFYYHLQEWYTWRHLQEKCVIIQDNSWIVPVKRLWASACGRCPETKKCRWFWDQGVKYRCRILVQNYQQSHYWRQMDTGQVCCSMQSWVKQGSRVTLLWLFSFFDILGTYSCLFVSGNIAHMAMAPIEIALLPEVINVTSNPQTTDCSEASTTKVTISCSIENSTETYTVRLKLGSMENTAPIKEGKAVIILYYL